LAICLSLFATAATANPFLSGRPSETNAAYLAIFSTPFMQQILAAQTHIHHAITDRIDLLKDGKSLTALWGLLLISVAYGVFHVLAPGHGKVIVTSYFLGNKARWRDGLWAGLVMAVGHTISAVGIVFVLYLALGVGQFRVLDDARYIELLGYGFIAAIGIWLLCRAFNAQPDSDTCGHDHGHHHHHATGLFAATSLVPCTGSMIILLFTLANNILWAGVLAVIAIALGMWVTVALIGLTSILLRRVVVGHDEHTTPFRRAIYTTSRALAALVVIMTGTLLFSGTLYSMLG
jgi:ABC-type nickel/cobalt efflux system permease component RcnA